MEQITKKCTRCGASHTGDFYELRKYFTTSKRAKHGLDPRCKECKREMAKNYKANCTTEKYKETHNRRNLYNKYINVQVENMVTEDIDKAIEVVENRLKELKREKAKRLG